MICKFAAKGFVFSKKRLVLDDLGCLEINNSFFYYEKDLDFRIKVKNEKFLILIGLFLDIREETSTTEKASDHLFSLIGTELFYEELDFYSGRYVVISGDSKNINALSDATAMKSIYYNNTFDIIASHSIYFRIINNENSLSEIENYKVQNKLDRYKYGYPGFYTPYDDNKILPPNFEINFTNKKINRFFPRKNLPIDSDINEVIVEINNLMINQVKSLIYNKKNIYSSLTSGLDSRYTLSITKDFKEIKHITYFYQKTESHLIDVHWAKLIASILNLKHSVLDLDKIYEDNLEEYEKYSSELYSSSVYSSHGHKVSFGYLKKFPKNSVLIRSNLYEIGRAFYNNKLKEEKLNELDAPALSKKLTYLYDIKLLDIDIVENAFLEYADTLTTNNIYNYEIADLFYWEHRMGIWHASVVAESDPAVETVVLCNSRKILNLFLSASYLEKKDAAIFKQSINQCLPELKNIPINKAVIDKNDHFDIHINIESNILYATIHEIEKDKNTEYAFYIYCNDNRVGMVWYSSKHQIEFQINEIGIYKVKGFIKKSDESKLSKLSSNVRFLGIEKIFEVKDIPQKLKDGRNNIATGNYIFETYYSKGITQKLVVLLNGAVGDRKNAVLPIFQRYTWADDIEDHVLNINDPTLYLDNNLRLGWYLGTKNKPLLPEIESLILGLANYLVVPTKDIVIYGSSGGGFGALNIASYIGNEIKSVAINPQINISKYVAKATVDLFYKISGFDKKGSETSILDTVKIVEQDFSCLIYQNKLDVHHYVHHFTPLLKELDIQENSFENQRIKNIVFEDPRGHIGENREMFSVLINKIRNIDEK